jgi:hypothetical protein
MSTSIKYYLFLYRLGRGDPRTLFLISSMIIFGNALDGGDCGGDLNRFCPSWQWLHLKGLLAPLPGGLVVMLGVSHYFVLEKV